MRRPAWTVLGFLLLASLVAGLLALPRGPQEFAYWPYVPGPPFVTPMRGFTFEQAAMHALFTLVGGLALVALWRGLGDRIPDPRDAVLSRLALGVATASVALSAAVLLVVLRGRAIVDDELAYGVQADLLNHGSLGEKAIHVVQWGEAFSVPGRHGFTGKYLFGEPLVQQIGVLVGLPALLHLPLYALTLLALHQSVLLLSGERRAADWALVVAACSPMWILTTATGLSHAAALCGVVVALHGYAVLRCPDGGRGRRLAAVAAVACGVGFACAVRPQVGAPAGVVLGGLAAWTLFRRRAWALLAALVALAGAWLASILLYDDAITGSPWKMPWSLFAPEHYGFGKVFEDGAYRHTLGGALANLGVQAIRLNQWADGWPLGLVLVALWWRSGRRDAATRVAWALALAVVAFEFGYYSTGISDTGPVYWYEVMVLLAVLAGATLAQPRNGWIRRLVLLQILVFTPLFLAWQTWRIGRLVETLHAPVEWALSRVEVPALLLTENRCSRTLRLGWIHSVLPVRHHGEEDPVVTWPRPPSQALDDYLEAYAGRRCYYFWFDPAAGHRLQTCDDALDALMEPPFDGRPCAWVRSTANDLGWYDPWAVLTEVGMPLPR